MFPQETLRHSNDITPTKIMTSEVEQGVDI